MLTVTPSTVSSTGGSSPPRPKPSSKEMGWNSEAESSSATFSTTAQTEESSRRNRY